MKRALGGYLRNRYIAFVSFHRVIPWVNKIFQDLTLSFRSYFKKVFANQFN